MADLSSGYGAPGISDRLSALRTPSPQGGNHSVAPRPRKIRTEVLVGGLVVLVGVGLALFAVREPASTATTNIDGSFTTVAQAEGENSDLTDGEALVAVAVETGNFPPSLTAGDVVRVIVTPNSNGVGEVHGLADTTIVHSVSPASDIGSQFVVTLRAPATAATALAASGPIHLAIIGVGTK
jgi:hypothetical protein